MKLKKPAKPIPKVGPKLPAIGYRIRERRLGLGWTQKQLADRYGCRQECLSQWETKGPSEMETVRKLAKILACDAGWLAFGTP